MALNVVMTKADREMLPKLLAVMSDDVAAPAEQEKAFVAAKVILKRYNLKWGDLAALTADLDAATRVADEERRRRQSAKAAPKNGKSGKNGKIDALTLAHHLLQKYIDVQPHEYVGLALWALHTHVYRRFYHTPRLALTSSTPECGKSNTFKCLKLLTRDPEAVSSISTAALFRLVDQGSTVIIDEADNAQLFTDHDKLGIVNGGFDKTANVVKRHKETFDTFGPMAFGGIGRLPAAIMSRALHIHLYRSAKNYPVLNPDDEIMRRPFDEAATLIMDWAEEAKLNLDPEMPPGLRGRYADKWRVLIAIADSFGAEWGERAREAAVASRDSYSDAVVQTMLLLDCEIVFNQRHVDRIRSEELLSGILELDTLYPWSAYRGPKDDENTNPRKLTQGDMARLLSMFNIRSKKIRFSPAPNGSFMGYERQQFERHWDAYGTKPGTPELKAIAGGKK